MLTLQCPDGFHCMEAFEDRGWVGFLSKGRVILLTHGEQDGSLPHLAEALAVMPRPDLVVCCYPHQVRHQHQELLVLGSWKGMTKVDWFMSFVEVSPLLG